DAGQSSGGDTRGMQSAGILVVRPIPPGSDSTVERVVDIRVDDHEQPFKELRRLLDMTLGVPNRLTAQSVDLAKAGRHADAIAAMQKALAINPRSEAAIYALAQRYAQAGQPARALEQLAAAIERQPKQWKPQAAADPLFASLKDMVEFRRLVAP
ncbi:MAG TPA: tetratricopeptide repeat protein, partial [Vicinamibacterales bacterium]|nr:tetratricopeptide repeat protein [Vicinamibacterales bacterium]